MSDQGNTHTEGPEHTGYAESERRSGGDSWWEDRSLPAKIMMGIGFGILGVGLMFLFGWVTMLLWNWLMPEIFGLTTITYWQSWGLLLLSFILFKGRGLGSESSGRKDRKRKRHLRRYMREGAAPTGDAAGEDPSPAPQT